MKQETIQEIMQFIEERDWDQFHSPENLAKSISIEAGELLECFQWDNQYDLEHVKEELADVLVYCIDLAQKLDVDIDTIIHEKMMKNAKKYPVTKVKGSSKKYDEYE